MYYSKSLDIYLIQNTYISSLQQNIWDFLHVLMLLSLYMKSTNRIPEWQSFCFECFSLRCVIETSICNEKPNWKQVSDNDGLYWICWAFWVNDKIPWPVIYQDSTSVVTVAHSGGITRTRNLCNWMHLAKESFDMNCLIIEHCESNLTIVYGFIKPLEGIEFQHFFRVWPFSTTVKDNWGVSSSKLRSLH